MASAFQFLFQFVSSARQLFLHSVFGCGGNRGYFPDDVAVEIEKGDGRALLGRQGAQRKVQALVLKAAVGRGVTDKRPGLIDTLRSAKASLVVEKSIVGNSEEPRAEFSHVLIARAGEVCLHQCVLRQVVGIVFVATAEGEQEAPKCLLLTLNMGNKFFARHLPSACFIIILSSASISLASIFLPRK